MCATQHSPRPRTYVNVTQKGVQHCYPPSGGPIRLHIVHSSVEPIDRMTPYGSEHITVLIFTVFLSIVAIYLARRIRGTRSEDRILQIAGWIVLAVTVFWTLWGFLPGNWNIEQSLPFQLSDAVRVITAIALLTRAGWAVAISYFWGLTLNLQSIVTPDLNYFDYPALEFVMYWFLHIAAFIVPIIFVWGLGYRPTWRGYGIAYAATLIWAGCASSANMLTGANYGYLSNAPAGPSVLDVLGPWPIYILWEAVIIAAVWAFMTWPWETRTGRSKGTVIGRMRAVRRK